MAPPIPSAKVTLSYPLYGADFDPENPAFLLVGGGGGESKSGVGNKLVSLRPVALQNVQSLISIWVDPSRHIPPRGNL